MIKVGDKVRHKQHGYIGVVISGDVFPDMYRVNITEGKNPYTGQFDNTVYATADNLFVYPKYSNYAKPDEDKGIIIGDFVKHNSYGFIGIVKSFRGKQLTVEITDGENPFDENSKTYTAAVFNLTKLDSNKRVPEETVESVEEVTSDKDVKKEVAELIKEFAEELEEFSEGLTEGLEEIIDEIKEAIDDYVKEAVAAEVNTKVNTKAGVVIETEDGTKITFDSAKDFEAYVKNNLKFN